MEQRGYLTHDGRVARTRRPDTIGTIHYRETRYNLRRTLVVREWIVRLDNGDETRGRLRREAIDNALKARAVNADR